MYVWPVCVHMCTVSAWCPQRSDERSPPPYSPWAGGHLDFSGRTSPPLPDVFLEKEFS